MVDSLGKQKNGGIVVDFAGVISSRGVLKCNISDMMAGAADTAYLNFYCGHRRFRFAIPGFGSQFSYLAQSKGTGALFTASTQVNFPYWVAVGGLAMPVLVDLAIWKRRKIGMLCGLRVRPQSFAGAVSGVWDGYAGSIEWRIRESRVSRALNVSSAVWASCRPSSKVSAPSATTSAAAAFNSATSRLGLGLASRTSRPRLRLLRLC